MMVLVAGSHSFCQFNWITIFITSDAKLIDALTRQLILRQREIFHGVSVTVECQ